ncbi:hypothetical protein [Bradyrhizobium sp.]|uniref:Calcium-binding protein n=1 Tax=Candidatus Afipia apatlaquensis TaxID=2712852 RepID=A0A7C9RN21_9BRAD|nr:hypothetical protein [Candidatus Afipia apatlaquensis]
MTTIAAGMAGNDTAALATTRCGGSGNDRLYGGCGIDLLVGGFGADVDSGNDVLLSRSDAAEMVAARDGKTQMFTAESAALV